MRRRLLVLCALVAFAAAPAWAQGTDAPAAPAAAADPGDVKPFGFESKVTPQQVQLGEPFIYELTITHAPNQRFELKVPADPGEFEVLEVARSRRDEKDRATTTFKVKMSMFELGKKMLPDLVFDVAEEGKNRRFVAPGIQIEAVSSLPPDAEEKGESLYDYKPPEDVPVRSWRLLYVLGGLLAAGALGYALYRYLKRPRVAVAPVKPKLPLDVRALQALDGLRAEDLPGKGRGREFFFRLSEILRGYLGERYRFEALECTSSELLEALRKLTTPGLELPEFRAFVQTSDMVKFAKLEPSPDECKSALEYSYQVVKATTAALAAPPPTAPPAAAAHGNGPRVP